MIAKYISKILSSPNGHSEEIVETTAEPQQVFQGKFNLSKVIINHNPLTQQSIFESNNPFSELLLIFNTFELEN